MYGSSIPSFSGVVQRSTSIPVPRVWIGAGLEKTKNSLYNSTKEFTYLSSGVVQRSVSVPVLRVRIGAGFKKTDNSLDVA